jgi:superfamily II DNA/RNA helicase
MLFTELPLCDVLQDGLQAMNFKETTPIQEQAIPVILEKKDVIACAQTGTGKTAAFLLPLLNNLQTDTHDENKINAIIMAPTRELAQQIDQQMEGFSYFTPFSSVAVYGGNDGDAWDVQKKGLLSGADVVIATPGRLLSHINLYNIDFSGVKYFILDEADRMLDMGFHDDIMKIEKLLPKERQTVMFSATMPPKIQQLAKSILRNPVDITIAISRPPETILQSAYICHESQKINIVKYLFKEKAPNKVILFSGSKQKVKEIAKTLSHMGLSAGEMHSDLDQSQRNHVMHEFKNERVNILVATDIVARGIDIDDITLVINFDVPYDADDYVHRIGRTARAGDSGMAITFVSPGEQYRFSKIERFLGKQIYRIPIPSELGEMPEYSPVRDNRRGGASARSSKGGGRKGTEAGKKGGKAPGRPDRSDIPGKSETPEALGKSESPEKSERTERLERSGRLEKQGRPENSGSLQQNQSPRSEKEPREGQARKQGAHKKQRTPKREEAPLQQGSPEKQGVSERQESSGKQGTSEGQGVSGEQGSSRKQRNPQAPRKQRASQDSNSPAADVSRKRPATGDSPNPKGIARPKRAVPSQKPDPAPEQTVKTDKPKKKWSWWPFGKK